jgi:hypothetical protein
MAGKVEPQGGVRRRLGHDDIERFLDGCEGRARVFYEGDLVGGNAAGEKLVDHVGVAPAFFRPGLAAGISQNTDREDPGLPRLPLYRATAGIRFVSRHSRSPRGSAARSSPSM